MNESIIKIIELLNKPLHFLIIGTLFVVWGYFEQSQEKQFIGTILIAGSLASFFEKTYNNRIEEKKRKQLKKSITQKFDVCNQDEKDILMECLKTNSLCYNAYRNVMAANGLGKTAIYSLERKGFGTTINDGVEFLLDEKVLEILKEHVKSS